MIYIGKFPLLCSNFEALPPYECHLIWQIDSSPGIRLPYHHLKATAFTYLKFIDIKLFVVGE